MPDGKTSICILPFDILLTFSAKALAPISINGPPPQLVAILNLCLSAAKTDEEKIKRVATIVANNLFIDFIKLLYL